MQANSKMFAVLFMMNILILGIFIGQYVTGPQVQAADDTVEGVPKQHEAEGIDALPPEMIYFRMNVPASRTDPSKGQIPGLFIFDNVNQTMRIYAFNNLGTAGSRGDIELLAVRDVRWDPMLVDTGLSVRGDEAKKLGRYQAQGMRPRDIFDLLVKSKIVDKTGNKIQKK
ncbi:hypothetical protein ACFL54_00360 [Planctomycetota bacterium]